MDEAEKAFVIAAIRIKTEGDRRRAAKRTKK